jgi:hypothetical protein
MVLDGSIKAAAKDKVIEGGELIVEIRCIHLMPHWSGAPPL